MDKPLYQKIVTMYFPWILLGIIFIASLVDAIKNLELIPPSVTYFGTLVIIISLICLEINFRKKDVYWIAEKGERVRIKSLGFKSTIVGIGLILALWIPRIFPASPNVSNIPPITIIPPAITVVAPYTLLEDQPNNQAFNTEWILNPRNGHYYQILNPCAWRDCEQVAMAEGAHLVTINDEEEQSWLVQTFPVGTYWIGFTDEGQEGDWRWVSGEPVTYVNWHPYEPNNLAGDENYGEMDLGSNQWVNNGKWNDDNGITPQPAIVEKAEP
jgi:hypothetical protein